MKKILALSFLVATVASSAFAAETAIVIAGLDVKTAPMTYIPACGPQARAKAGFSRQTGDLTLRVCGNQYCSYPVWINTNAKYELKADTNIFARGTNVGNGCEDFSLNYRVQANQSNIRAVFGGGFFQNQAKIDIKF